MTDNPARVVVRRNMRDSWPALTLDEFIAMLHRIRHDVPEQYQRVAVVSFDAEVDDILGDGELVCTDIFMNVEYLEDVRPEAPDATGEIAA